MRLFIAIRFNSELIDSIESITNQLINLGVRGRRTKTSNIHLTLAFIGECETPDTLINVLDNIESKHFNLTLNKCSHFKDTVWIGTNIPTELTALTKQLTLQLQANGYEVPNRDFIPHITLFRKASNYEHVLDRIAIANTIQKVESISLMKSTLTNSGTIYEEIYTKHLN